MRRMTAACALLLLLLLSCLGLWKSTRCWTREASQPLILAAQCASLGQWDEARALTRRAQERWESRSFLQHLLLPHRELDDIALSFTAVRTYLDHQALTEYSAASAVLLRRLEFLADMERPCLENIL